MGFVLKDGLSGPEVIGQTHLLHISIRPHEGGKTTSLISVKTGREWLWRHPNPPRQRPAFGASYGAFDISGWDERFPSVAPCAYPEEPWEGVDVPDHGELWYLPWDFHVDGDRAHIEVHGVRFPYIFRKSFELTSPKCLEISYEIENRCPYPLKGIWSSQALIEIEPGMKIELPGKPFATVDSSAGGRLGNRFERHAWPVTMTKGGEALNLAVLHRPRQGTADKLYIRDLRDGRCKIVMPTGETLSISWPIRDAPFLGLWYNLGGWPADDPKPFSHLGIGPSTSGVDALDLAARAKEGTTVFPRKKVQWKVRWEID